jgi:hypothetical protein
MILNISGSPAVTPETGLLSTLQDSGIYPTKLFPFILKSLNMLVELKYVNMFSSSENACLSSADVSCNQLHKTRTTRVSSVCTSLQLQ